ncbi:hypothetical protein U0070_023223, partial [Myodes glareolus]
VTTIRDAEHRNVSEVPSSYTSGNTPPAPLPPKLKEAGVYSLWLELRLGFKPNTWKQSLLHVRNLQRHTTYKFGFCLQSRRRSNPSREVKYLLVQPSLDTQRTICSGSNPCTPSKIAWDSPKTMGSHFKLQFRTNLWKIIYNGTPRNFCTMAPTRHHITESLLPSPVGQSQPSDVLTLQTYLPPASCRSLPLNSKTNARQKPSPWWNCTSSAPSFSVWYTCATCKGPTCVVVSWEAFNRVGVGMFGETVKVTTPGTVPTIVPMLQEAKTKFLPNCPHLCIAIQLRIQTAMALHHGYNIEYGDKKIACYDRPTNKSKTKPILPEPPQLDCVVQEHHTPKLHPLDSNICEIKWDSLEPIKGDPIVYSLQVFTGKKAEQIYKGPNTTFSFSNYLANSKYRFKVCAGRQYENSDGMQELWGPYSSSSFLSTYKLQSGCGKGSGGKRRGNHNSKDKKHKNEKSNRY